MPTPTTPLRLMPLGDSITRGSYLVKYEGGRFAGTGVGLPHPAMGGWRRGLQARLRAAGVAFTCVGELDYGAYGTFGGDDHPEAGVVDPAFCPWHHGCAGFSNRALRLGGVVPTPQDVLTAKGVTEIRVPDIATVLARHQPDVILLMAGTNGFDAGERELLVREILAHSRARLLVATIPPQRLPREGCERVAAYNAALAPLVAALRAAGHPVGLVDLHAAVRPADLLADGVHPSAAGMECMAAAWFAALSAALG